MKNRLLCGAAAAALLTFSQSANANTLVASIIGAYDQRCSAAACVTAVNNPNITNYANNNNGNPAPFDTPNLFILNPTNNAFTNLQIALTGYQDAAGGGGNGSIYVPGAPDPATLTIGLPNIAAHTVYQLIWGSGATSLSNLPQGDGVLTFSGQHGINLFSYDYDDLLGNPAHPAGDVNDPAGHHCGTNDTSNHNICAFIGNFDVSFSALLNGNPISSVFSPDNTQGGGNAQGAFVGWIGLDQDGLSETLYDVHTDTFPGTLANIYTGTNQSGGGRDVPEPASLA
ncbi:MAG: hypothetical protein H0U98_17735, partial [Alphaproteobacteria bacterium]|nr:hypothetical protein [Alphaproteobacteria bacterium]